MNFRGERKRERDPEPGEVLESDSERFLNGKLKSNAPYNRSRRKRRKLTRQAEDQQKHAEKMALILCKSFQDMQHDLQQTFQDMQHGLQHSFGVLLRGVLLGHETLQQALLQYSAGGLRVQGGNQQHALHGPQQQPYPFGGFHHVTQQQAAPSSFQTAMHQQHQQLLDRGRNFTVTNNAFRPAQAASPPTMDDALDQHVPPSSGRQCTHYQFAAASLNEEVGSLVDESSYPSAAAASPHAFTASSTLQASPRNPNGQSELDFRSRQRMFNCLEALFYKLGYDVKEMILDIVNAFSTALRFGLDNIRLLGPLQEEAWIATIVGGILPSDNEVHLVDKPHTNPDAMGEVEFWIWHVSQVGTDNARRVIDELLWSWRRGRWWYSSMRG